MEIALWTAADQGISFVPFSGVLKFSKFLIYFLFRCSDARHRGNSMTSREINAT